VGSPSRRPRRTCSGRARYGCWRPATGAFTTRLWLGWLDDREIPFADRKLAIRDALWGGILLHLIHHRGQLSMMCRLAGGTPASIYGPNREEMEAMRERMQTAKA
jgi:uncharacterized damage-inducible protein DinB